MTGDGTTLPHGWTWGPLGNVADFEMGQAPPGSASNFSGEGTVFVKAGEFGKDYPVVREWTTAPLKYAKTGDVLICVVGATAGKLNLGIDCAIGRSVAAIRPTGAVLQRIIYRQLQARVGSMRASSSGSAQGVISKEMLAELPIAIPPQREQQRIADKLDAVLARVDVCRNRLDRVPAILKRFRQAVVGAAVAGDLTEDWRVEKKLRTDGWERASVERVAQVVFDGPFGSHLKSLDYSESGVRVVRLENIAQLRFLEDKRTFIPEEKFEQLRRHTLVADDVLFSSFVDEEVRVCMLPAELSGKAINKADCFCIRVDKEKCIPAFLALRLASRSTFASLDDLVHGATRPRINLTQLRAIEFGLPTMAEQAEIICRVEALFAFAACLEARLTQAQAAVDRLAPSLLAKAFRGELVPQDPADEPASALLARLSQRQQEQAPATGVKRPRGRPKKAT